ncbi:MAG TPA: Crp/Fnr family transcriptional regulator [Candidatus Saccharimonadales bacterium]|nr:Crp/Fnr family transcriptional regulator [Candidatus Saccharimonadales bacterium]
MDTDTRLLWGRFIDQQPIRSFKSGQMLLFQGESPQSGYVIKKGIVKSYDINAQGDEQLAYLLTSADVFPYPWLLNQTPTSHFYYESLTDTELRVLNKQAYQFFLRKTEGMIIFELEKYARSEVKQAKRLTSLLNSKAVDKLINVISYLAINYGTVIGHNIVQIGISLTHQEIANLTGLRRETVAVGLNKLKRKGVIHYGRDREFYEVDLSQLNRLINASTSSLKPVERR